jgi:hypothetical protein
MAKEAQVKPNHIQDFEDGRPSIEPAPVDEAATLINCHHYLDQSQTKIRIRFYIKQSTTKTQNFQLDHPQ